MLLYIIASGRLRSAKDSESWVWSPLPSFPIHFSASVGDMKRRHAAVLEPQDDRQVFLYLVVCGLFQTGARQTRGLRMCSQGISTSSSDQVDVKSHLADLLTATRSGEAVKDQIISLMSPHGPSCLICSAIRKGKAIRTDRMNPKAAVPPFGTVR